MVGHVAYGHRTVPVQPAAGQAAELALRRQLTHPGQQILAVPGAQAQEKRETRQTRDFRVHLVHLDLDLLADSVQAVGSAYGRAAQAVAAEAHAQEHGSGAGHGLAQIDDQSAGAGGLHLLAEGEHVLALAEGVHQPADAAVDPGLIAEAGIVVVLAGEGRAILMEAGCGHAVPGINHAVRVPEHLVAVAGHVEGAHQSALDLHRSAVTLQHVLHGGILFLHPHLRRLLAHKEQIRHKRWQQGGYILTNHCEFHGITRSKLQPSFIEKPIFKQFYHTMNKLNCKVKQGRCPSTPPAGRKLFGKDLVREAPASPCFHARAA